MALLFKVSDTQFGKDNMAAHWSLSWSMMSGRHLFQSGRGGATLPSEIIVSKLNGGGGANSYFVHLRTNVDFVQPLVQVLLPHKYRVTQQRGGSLSPVWQH